MPLTWPSHNCGPPVIFCVLRYTVKDWTLFLLHQEMVMTITLKFTEGHLCRAGEAPWNWSLRRRGIIIPFWVIVVKETWTEPGMGARGEQEEGQGWMLWVHENADTWAFWGSQSVGSWRGERTAEGSSLLYSEQWPDQRPIPSLYLLVTCLRRLPLGCWVLAISKVQYHHWESPSDWRCCNSFGYSRDLGVPGTLQGV